MADERDRTTNLTDTTATRTGTLDADRHDANRDPLTGEPGAHPVGTGVGAASGGTIGAVIGGAVGGPVGAIIGAAIGGMTGGFAGKGLAESVNPTEEDTFWSGAYKDRPYAQGRDYDELRPAYRYGWESRTRHTDRDWNDVESDLQKDWSTRQGTSNLDWNTAKPAAYDAWNRVDNRHRYNTEEEPFWKETAQSRPYAQNKSYDDLSPAYRYGWESGRSLGREGRFEDHENALERGWDKAKGKTQMAWHEAKDAVRDSWNRATSRWNDDEDSYWRNSWSTRPYASGRTYDDLRPAYRYGYESATYYQGRQWNDVEGDLRSTWDRHSTRSKWDEVKDAVRDAWDRGTHRVSNTLNKDTTGTYSPAAGTTLGTGLGSGTAGTAGVSAGGTYPAGTGYNTTVPTATDMIGGATEGAHTVHDPTLDKNRKI
jgi:thymidylate synthase